MAETPEEMKERIRNQKPKTPKPYGGGTGAKDTQVEDPETYQGSVLAKMKKPPQTSTDDVEAQPKQNPGEPLGAYAARVRKWRENKKDGTKAGQAKALEELK